MFHLVFIGVLIVAMDQSGRPFGMPGSHARVEASPVCLGDAGAALSHLARAPSLAIGTVLSDGDRALLRKQDPLKIRLLGKSGAGTMDFVRNRLNIHLDQDGRIVRLSCG